MNTTGSFSARTMLVASLLLAAATSAARPGGPEDRILFPGAARLAFVGPFGGIDAAMHRGGFTTTDRGIVCCSFDEGTGIGPVAGLKAFLPIFGPLDFSPRVLYENLGGRFDALRQRYPIRGLNNAVELADLADALDVDLHALTVDLLASYRVTPFGLYVAAGPSAAWFISNRFANRETIAAPPGVTYLDGSTAQTVSDASSDNVHAGFLSVRGGAGVVLRVSDAIAVNPEVLYILPLTKISSAGDWKVHAVQATLGLLFRW
jgi:hypothetical protein